MRPLRILHVVGGMDYGGVETWLMQLLRRMDRNHFLMEFLTLTERPAVYDQEIRRLGSRLIPCLDYRRPWQYARSFRRIIRNEGPYDIIHCHFQEYSGFVAALAHQAGIPVRIVHSHSDALPRWVVAKLPRRLYMRLMQQLMTRYATLRLAVSRQAAESLFGIDSGATRPWQILPCGIDPAPFAAASEAEALRAELDLPPAALVIGHVGRLTPVKNHSRLLQIMAVLAEREPRAHLLLVGDGPLRAQIEQQAAQPGLAERVTILGARDDVARLMLGAMDVFVLPSLYEGLGLAGIEAQAAGLPCLFSTAVPAEAMVVAPLVQRLSLHRPDEEWASAVLEAGQRRATIDRTAALELVRRSSFNLEQEIVELAALYSREARNA